MMFPHFEPIRHKVSIPVAVDWLITQNIRDNPEMVVEVLVYLFAESGGPVDMPFVFSRNDEARHLLEDLRGVVVCERRKTIRKALAPRIRNRLNREAARYSVLLDAWNADGRDKGTRKAGPTESIDESGGNQHGI